ncbi:MAG: hypothetical protein V4649_09620 [Bacteroidota bacterium]
MKRILYKILLLTLPVIALFYALQYIVNNGLRRSKMQYYAVWNDIYNGATHADILITGPSRTWMQISPRILDSVLPLNSYNIGIDGWYFPMQYARFRVFMQHNPKPKYVIQNVDLLLFLDRKDLFLSEQFLPYLGDTIIRNITNDYKGKYSFAEYWFPLFRYNNHINLIKEGVRSYFQVGRQSTNKLYKGYAGIDQPWNNVYEEVIKHNPNGITRENDPKVVKLFEEYLEYCKQNGIQLIFVFQPILNEELALEKSAGAITGLIKKYAAEYNIPYLDYSNDAICYDRRYFIDHQHLNREGAELFSRKLAADLKPVIR